MANDRIHIEVSGDGASGVPAGELFKVLRNSLAVLHSIANHVDPLDKKLGEWIVVDASRRNPIVHSFECAVPGRSGEIGDMFIRGLAALESGQGDIPDYFVNGTLERCRRLVMPLDRGVKSIKIASNGQSVAPTQRVAARAHEAMQEMERYYSYDGSVEGVLEAVNVHGKMVFSVFDELTDKQVDCEFAENMYDLVHGLMRTRVLVSGEVRFDTRDDRPVSVLADEIEPFEDEGDLLIKDMRPIKPDNGMSSEDFIRQLRDE